MSLHKLTAGDGYTYLTRSVAAADVDLVTGDKLEAYYSARGESPGAWMGRGLPGLALGQLALAEGDEVTEAHMRALFGVGRNPLAEEIQAAVIEEGGSKAEALQASRLGREFMQTASEAGFVERVDEAVKQVAGERGEDSVTADERARIKSAVARSMFTEVHGRVPLDDAELSGFVARASRPARQATSGYDLTFSPVKSVSTLWAVADRGLAQAIRGCHDDAVRETLTWLEGNAAFTRQGTDGVKQVETNGLIAAGFTHRDSRAGDPDLHTHVAVSNKVQARDGSWLALDGRLLFRSAVTASERYNTRLEALLRDRLGVAFAPVEPPQDGKREVREIVGVDAGLMEAWSSRRASIEARQAQLAEQFQHDHGRAPTPAESVRLAQQATLETRPDKAEARSEAEQRADWRDQARGFLGGTDQIQQMIATVLAAGRRPPVSVAPFDPDVLAARVLTVLEKSRSWWREANVRAEAERAVRRLELPAGEVDMAVDQVVTRVLHGPESVLLTQVEHLDEPDVMRRSDGASVHEVHGSRVYSSTAVMAAEERVIEAARLVDGRQAGDVDVALALLEVQANGITLNEGQEHMVHELAQSGRRVQLVLAPAGTGKTTSLHAVAIAWANSGGNVVALAPSAAAAKVLGAEIDVQADTLAKAVYHLDVEHAADAPTWMGSVGPGTLVVVDEAGMASTKDLDAVIGWAMERGASVRLVGDDRQLSAVGAGGVLADIKAEQGAVSLREVMRFAEPAEASASLALREGDAVAVGFYADHGRVHVAQAGAQAQAVFTAWQADTIAGKTSLMLAPTGAEVDELNTYAQTWRRATGDVDAGTTTALASGARAGAGDVILTRKNDRRLTHGSHADFVKNGDRWTVKAVRPDGGLDVVNARTHAAVTLPRAYVAASVELGYASTVHRAQGLTVDTAHVILAGTETSDVAYVGLTRGRAENHAYVAVGAPGSEADQSKAESHNPATGMEILARIVARQDAAAASAHTTARQDQTPDERLSRTAPRYADAVLTAARELLPAEAREQLRERAEESLPGVTANDGWDVLESQLALGVIGGQEPADVVAEVFDRRSLDDAENVMAVLVWRAEHAVAQAGDLPRPVPWAPPLPQALAQDETWGTYLRARYDLVATDASDVAAQAQEHLQADERPAWMQTLAHRPDLVRETAMWRAGHHVPESVYEPVPETGGGPTGAGYAARLRDRVDDARPHTITARAQWRDFLDQRSPGIGADPELNRLMDRLAAAERTGIDARGIVTEQIARGPLPAEQPAAALWWRVEQPIKDADRRPALSPEAAARLARLQRETSTAEPPVDTEPVPARTGAERLAALRADINRDPPRQTTPDPERRDKSNHRDPDRVQAEEARRREQQDRARREEPRPRRGPHQ